MRHEGTDGSARVGDAAVHGDHRARSPMRASPRRALSSGTSGPASNAGRAAMPRPAGTISATNVVPVRPRATAYRRSSAAATAASRASSASVAGSSVERTCGCTPPSPMSVPFGVR